MAPEAKPEDHIASAHLKTKIVEEGKMESRQGGRQGWGAGKDLLGVFQ